MTFSEWSNNKKKKQQEEQEQERKNNTKSVLGNKTSFSDWSNNKISSQVDENYINSFLSDSKKFFEDSKKDSEGKNYGTASSLSKRYSTSASDLRHRANYIRIYLEFNKNSINQDTYNKLYSYVTDIDTDLSSVENHFTSYADAMSKFKTEDEYDEAIKLSDLYNMSTEELAPHINASKSVGNETDKKISALRSEKENLEMKKSGYERGHVANSEDYNNIVKRIKQIGEEIYALEQENTSSNIAYTTLGGQNITWQSLYDQKKAEEDFNALYSDLSSRGDWEDASQYKPTFKAGDTWSVLTDTDHEYEATNRITGYGAASSGGSAVDKAGYADVTTKEEKAVFNYLYHTQGKEAAMEWHKSRADIYKARREQKGIEDAVKFAEDYPVISDLVGVASSVLSGGEYVADILRGDIGDTNQAAAISSAIKSTRMEQIDWEVGEWDVFDFLYGTGTSMLESAASVAMFGGGGGIALGLSAAAQGTNDALNRGMSKGQAFVSGAASGIFEGIFESWSIGAFGDLTKNLKRADVRNIAKYIGKNMWNNAKEETLTEIANIVYDTMINGEFSQAETSIRQLMASGISESNAKKQVALELGLQVAETAGSGALMGFGFATFGSGRQGGAIATVRRMASEGNAIQNAGEVGNLVDLGKSFGEGTESYDLANTISDKSTALAIGSLLEIAEDDVLAANRGDIIKSLERKGYDTKKANRLADLMLNPNNSIFANSKGFTPEGKTYNDIINNPNSTTNQRTEKYLEILNNLENNNKKSDTSVTSQNNANFPYSQEYIDSVVKEFEKIGIPTEKVQILAKKRLSTLTESNYFTPTEEKVVESKFEVSAEGKTADKNTGKIVNIQNIESVSEDGEINLNLDDGMVVKASDLSFGSDAEAIFVENIGAIKVGEKSISTASANDLYEVAMTAYKSNPNMTASEAMSLIKGLTESYIYGAYNLGRSRLTSRNKDGSARLFAGELTQEQRKLAYELGSKDSVSNTEADQKVIDELKAKAEGKTPKKSLGKVVFEKGAVVDESTLTKTQKANLEGIKLLAEISSIEFHVFRSDKVDNDFKYTMSDGTVTSANGWFVIGSNEIWVDLNAGNFGEGTMIRTAAHEISHYIKEWSGQKWKAMADLLMQSFAENGIDTENMLRSQIDKIKRRYKAEKEAMPSEPELLDMAYEELVCDALSDMLTDGSIVNFMAEVKAKDRNLGQKILDAIKSLLKKWGLIIDDYKGRKLDTAEAQALSQLEDTFKKLQEMYRDAFIDANETVATLTDYAKNNAEKTQKNTTIEDNVKFADREHYWVSGFSHNEMSYVERIAKHEVERTNNYIDIENKWLYNNRKDKPYFAIYSTAHIDNPTVMYASKGSKATKEYKWFMNFIAEMEMTKNGRNDLPRKTINEVLVSLGYALDKGGLYSGKPTRPRNNRNVGVYSGTSRIKPSEALLNCIKNIGEKQGQTRVVKYSDRNIDNARNDADNLSRANKQGELVNDYYYALTSSEWRTFYTKITKNGSLATAKVGTVTPIVVNDKLIIAERLYTGKDAHDYVVTDAYKLFAKDGDTYTLSTLQNALNKGELDYDTQRIFSFVNRLNRLDGRNELLARYNRDNFRFDVAIANRKQEKSTEGIHGDSQKRIAGERLSLRDKSSIQEDDELLKLSDRNNTDLNIYSNRKSLYNEYHTNAMQWAYSASTKEGDTKILSVNGKSFALLEATENGYVEIARGNYKEVLSNYEEMQRRADNSLYGYTQKIRTDKSGNMRSELSYKEVGRDAAGSSRQTGSKRLQTDTAGNNEHLHSGDKGESKQQKVNSSLRKNVDQNKIKRAYSLARARDSQLIAKAEEYESQNKSRKFIFKETGLVRDPKGIWLYELDDSKMRFYPNGDARKKNDSLYQEYLKYVKIVNSYPEFDFDENGEMILTDEQAKVYHRYCDLIEILEDKYGFIDTLKDYVVFDELFEKYPQIGDAKFIIGDFGNSSALGGYDPENNAIYINKNLYEGKLEKQYIEDTIIHEIQHALQTFDERESGSSEAYWNFRLARDGYLPYSNFYRREFTPYEAYFFTAGEIEAREVVRRRKNGNVKNPDILPYLFWDYAIYTDEYFYSPEKKKAKYSTRKSEYTDSDYLSAVEKEDAESLRNMVDAAAENAGYTERLYHQTGADFTEFNTEKQRAGKFDHELPEGIFLKPSDKDIGPSGKNQMELFAKIQNPLHFGTRHVAAEYWKRNIPKYADVSREITSIDRTYSAKIAQAEREIRAYISEWKNSHPKTSSSELYKDTEFQRLYDLQGSITEEWENKSNEASLRAKQLINEFVSRREYDGIIIDLDQGSGGRFTKTYIVYDSSQLKSAEPVTYDNEGNVIALSERFNSEKKDIRYSDRDSLTKIQYDYPIRYREVETNSEILSMVEKIERGECKPNEKVYLGIVPQATTEQIYNLTGIRVNGYKVAIEARQIEHILKNHGKQGVTDKSMADYSNIAKMEYALNVPDSITAAGKTQAYTHMVNGKNKTVDTVLYEKNIGEKSYYVVQAIPDTKAKTLYIVTAFIGKKGYKKEASQLINAKSLDVTAKTGSVNASVNMISQESNSVKMFSERDSNKSFSEEFTTKTLNSFGVKKLNDSIHIQRQVLTTLLNEEFFTDTENRKRIDVNKESRLVVETNKSGIDETFSFNNFVRLGKFKKIAKLATIRELPNIIENGHVVADNVANKYDNAVKNKKFAYIEHSIEVDGKDVVVKLAIKKSPQKNKFWVHSIYTIENVSDSPASTNKGAETGHITADIGNIIPQDTETVKIFSERDSNNKIKIGSYTESQYDNFGWVRANDVLTAAEYNTLLSRYADFKHNKDNYPTTRFGEAVIFSFEYPDVLMYVRGTIRNPQITKVLKIDSSIPNTIQSDIQKEILSNERNGLYLPWENVTFIFGEGTIDINKKRDFPSFQEYKRRSEREISKTVDSSDRVEQERARNPEQSENIYKKHEIKRDDRDPNASNRAILANALEGTAKNDIESKKLAEYKEKIAQIEAEEKILSEIQKQLFTKGAVESSQRKDLQFEAKQIANRINTYDRQLLNLESTTALKNVLNREKALAMERQKQEDAEYLKQYKEKVAKNQRKILERNQESRKKSIENRERTAMRHKIQKVVSETLWGVADSISSICGIPTKNVRRDINGAINLFETLKADAEGRKTTEGSLLDEIWEDVKSSIPIAGWIPNDTKADKLYDAIVKGDTAYIERLKSTYKDDKAYESAVRKALRENDSRIKQAAEARIGGDIAEYARLIKEIKAEGYFTQDTIVASVNAEINAINKGESSSNNSSAEDKASSIYKIDDYYASIVGGDQASAYVVKEDIINIDVANGKDRDEAESSFNSRFASYLRERFEDGYITEREVKDMLVKYGDKSEEDASSKVQYWTFKQEYPDYDDLSEEAVTKYYKKVEPYGISVSVYYDYSKQRSKCSVKAEVLKVINSLPLTYAQKDALYYLNGWSAKTIYEAPWH